MLFIVGESHASQGSSLLPNNHLFQLREELVGTIQDLYTNGDSGLEEALAELVTQLEHMQSSPGEPMRLDWEHAGLNSTVSKKVCIVVSSFEGLYINSGIGTAYYALAELLTRSGHHVTVLYTRDQPPTTGSFNDWVNHYAAQGIELKSLPASEKRLTNPKLQVISAQVYAYLKQNQYNIVHFADFEGLGFYSTLAKRVGLAFEDTLFVAGLHGPTRWVLDANEKRVPFHETELEVDYMERTSVENSDIVWTPSNAMASWLSQQGWNLSQSVHLLPLPPGPEVRTALDVSNVKAKEFVYFGRLEKRKGIALFCDSIDLLSSMGSMKNDLIITFLGTSGFIDGKDSMEYIQSRSSKWSFSVNVISNATREAAIKYLTERDSRRIPVIPSLVDNAPYTVYECLYSGIPFLASATPSITPLLAKAGHHLFELKPHHLASRMVYAVKNGLSSAQPTFTVREAEATWISFYSTLSTVKVERPVSDDLPVVSVCLIHYNRPELVQQAIASINSQDYKKIEVILVDDGSNSTEAIEYLKSLEHLFDVQDWKIIRTENRYLGAARNTAAKQATGKYVLFLDDDNVAYPHQISTYVAAAERTKAHILTAGHAVFHGTSAPTAESIDRYWYPLGPSLAVGLYKNCFGDANFFVQKDIFLALDGFTEEHSVGLEEHEFFAKAVLAGYQLEVIPEPLLYYRMHDESTQMVFTLDPRLGEARRIRPYLDALAATSDVEKRQEQAARTRRSLVHLVARNSFENYQDCNQTLSSCNPTTGPISGGTTISLKGVGFSCGVQAVRVGGIDCTGITIVSNYEITCQTPQGVKTYAPLDITADVGGTTIALYTAFTYTALAAPALSGCRLSDDGASIDCTFSSVTDESSGSCSNFFTADTTSSFGLGANCFWSSSTIMTIDLGSGATIAVGAQISILAGVVKSQGDSTVSNEASSTQLLEPLNAAYPKASITTSSSVAACEGITLDASSSTGGMGRALTYTWALLSIVPADSASQTAVTAALSSASSSVSIQASDVVVATYTFQLTVTNWIGASKITIATVTKSASAVPSVSISGSSVVEIFASAALTLNGQVTSSCGNTLGSVTYVWSIVPTIASALSTSASLTIPANTLSTGIEYVVTLTATDNGISNSASVTVTVNLHPLIASISGGNKQFELASTVTLDGSASSDPEGKAISFSWSCVNYYDSSKPCSIDAVSDALFAVAANSFGTGKYTVTLTVSGTAGRTASTSVWVEVAGVSVLAISIQALASNQVIPSQQLSLVGVLDQANVELSDVTWSWSLAGGSLVNPGSAYLSSTTAQTLIIGANVLTPGSSYTYKLTAIQTSTGMTGSATVSFSVSKAATGDLSCPVTTGNAEETDFTYDFSTMSSSSSNIVSYELRFVPQGSSIEIPLAEPGTATSISTKLPVGTYTIVGIATSADGVSTRKECSASVKYSSASAGLASLATLAGQSGLSPFQIARYTYGAKVAFASAGSSSSSTYENIRTSLIAQGASATTPASVTALTGAYIVLTDSAQGAFTKTELITAISACVNLVNAQIAIKSSLNASVIAADLIIVNNMIDQISKQNFDVKVLVKRDTSSDQDMWSAFQSVMEFSETVAQLYLSSMTNGQSMVTIQHDLLTVSFLALSTSTVNSQGVSLGKSSTLKLPANVVPQSVSSDTMAFALSSWGVSPYPSSASVVSPVIMLSASASGSSVDMSQLSSPAIIYVPNSELLETSNLACVTWSPASSNWTTASCQTAAKSDGVTCTCDSLGSFAIMSEASSKASNSKSGSGGLDGKWIAVIAAVGGVALIAVIAGTVFGVRRHRRNQAAPVALPAVPAVAPVVMLSTDGVVVPMAGAIPATPGSVAGSSYSSASSRSIVSSSSSEEEAMEQQIKDIVGELSTAMPRDPRALEVLGDRLDME